MDRIALISALRASVDELLPLARHQAHTLLVESDRAPPGARKARIRAGADSVWAAVDRAEALLLQL